MGHSTTASANWATAMGFNTTASGLMSTAMGAYTTAPSYTETVIGRYNTTYTPNNPNGWDAADQHLWVGNGTSSSAA